MAKELNKIAINEVIYYVDWRLLQLRNVTNPHNYIQYNSVVEMKNEVSLCINCNYHLQRVNSDYCYSCKKLVDGGAPTDNSGLITSI